jgi:two-component system sensor histidine kinase/response regulator
LRNIFSHEFGGLNLQEALVRVAGNHSLLHKAMSIFLQEQSNAYQDIRKAFESHDLEFTQRLVHTLKGQAGTIGAERLHQEAIELEQALNDKRSDTVPGLLVKMKSALLEVLDSIEKVEVELADQDSSAGIDSEREGGASEDTSELINQLKSLLEIGDVAAVDTLGNIECIGIPSEVSEQFSQLKRAVEKYEFRVALELLHGITSKLD